VDYLSGFSHSTDGNRFSGVSGWVSAACSGCTRKAVATFGIAAGRLKVFPSDQPHNIILNQVRLPGRGDRIFYAPGFCTRRVDSASGMSWQKHDRYSAIDQPNDASDRDEHSKIVSPYPFELNTD